MESSEHWAKYWQHGFLHSCHAAFADNYSDEILQRWRQFFALAPDGGRLLDIGTGNGAVALIARDTLRSCNRAQEIFAIDRARIAPATAAAARGIDMSGIEFRGETPAEDTGFPDGYFDMACGQYAMEYTDIERAVPELARITRCGAQLAFVMHHPDSVIHRTALREIENYELTLDETHLVDHACELLRELGDRQTPQEMAALAVSGNAERLRARYNDAAARVTERIAVGEAVTALRQVLGVVAHAFNNRKAWGSNRAIDYLEAIRREHCASLARLRDHAAAVVTPARLREIGALFARHYLAAPRTSVLRLRDRTIMGWWIRSRRL